MTVYKEFNIGQGGRNSSPLGSFGPIIGLVLLFVLLYFVAKGVFTILSWVAPLLLIATAIIDYKVILDYGKFIFKLLKDNPIMGIVGIVLTVVGFPVVSGFLFFRALARRTIKSKVEQIKQQREGEYTEYEEVKEDEEDFLKLPPIEKPKPQNRAADNEYEDLFD